MEQYSRQMLEPYLMVKDLCKGWKMLCGALCGWNDLSQCDHTQDHFHTICDRRFGVESDRFMFFFL